MKEKAMKYKDDTSEDEVLRRCIASFTSGVSNDQYKDGLKELQKRMLFDSGITAGICQGLKIAYEYRQHLQKEIKTVLKRQIFNIPAGASFASTYKRRLD
jgi:hypothetical protein